MLRRDSSAAGCRPGERGEKYAAPSPGYSLERSGV